MKLTPSGSTNHRSGLPIRPQTISHKIIYVRMSEEEYHEIQAEALAADSSVSEFIRIAAKSRIAHQRALRSGKPDEHMRAGI
jgi:hypothetical protein